jgi:nucleoside-diphosphate-sugar epimerase
VYPVPREFLQDYKSTYDFISKLKPNYIIHAGSYGNQHYQTDDTEIFNANVISTHNLLTASNHLKYKSFIYLSSSSVYGNKRDPMNEDMALNGTTMYARCKIAGESVCLAHAIKYAKPITIVRPFSVYGTGEQEHRLVPQICKSISGGAMSLNPDSMHDWIYIKDFVDAVVMLMTKRLPCGEIYNVGSGEQHSNMELVEKIEWITDRECKFMINKDIKRPDEKQCWVADISKIKALGWKPEYTLVKGLKKSINLHIPEYD